MSDYVRQHDFSPKDALVHGDPNKLILGVEADDEFDAIVTAVATKYDSSDIASQAQAVAGASNLVLMTPLRVAQYLTGAGGGSGAGMVGDIILLADPGQDRGLFWDDSADAVGLFSLGTGLNFTGTVLGLTLGAIDHNALLNYVADQHVAHSGVLISTAAAGGLTGGGDITATRALSINIPGLAEDTTPVTSTDYVMTYDASAAALKKVLGDNLVGARVGDGRFYNSAGQAIGVASTAVVVFDTTASNNLERGTFSTSTGVYTATASAGARLLITATIAVASLGASRSFSAFILKNGGIITRSSLNNFGGVATTPGITISAVVSLAFNETVSIGAFVTTAANTLQAGEAYSSVSIVELG